VRRSLCAALVCALATLTAPPALAATEVVTGTVVDPQGQPIAGAAVWLIPNDFADRDSYLEFLRAGPAAVTGTDGRFAVSHPDASEWIKVCAPGALTDGVDPTAALAGPVTVVLRPAARLSGQVLAADGAPVDGLSVSARLAGPSGIDCLPSANPCGDYECNFAGTSTDGEGRFALTPLVSGWYTISTGTDPLAIRSPPLHLAPGQALDGLRLLGKRGAQVTGRVTARDGSPVPEATVDCGSVVGLTDAAGRYRLAGVVPGHQKIRAYDLKHAAASREVELAAGENHLDLELPDPKVIHGRVLGPDGKPAAGATVKLEMSVARAAVTAADGTFRLSTPGCTNGELTVQAAGLSSAEVAINCGPGALEIHLSPGTIAGRLLGLPSPAGTKIYATAFFMREPASVEAVADAAGRFRLPGLAPGTWSLAADQGGRLGRVDVAVVPGKESTGDISFPPVHRVSGWVVDGDGRPVACDEVELSRVRVPCGGDGTFAIEAEDGKYYPSVFAGGRVQEHEPLTIEVAGAPLDKVEIRLIAGVTVTGRILGLQPGEIADGIQAQPTGAGHYSSGTPDQDGGYRMEALPGDWKLNAHFKTMTAERRLHIPAGATRIEADITFTTGPYELAGRAGEEAILALAGPYGVTVTSSLPSKGGRFLFSRLAAGTYTLRTLRSNGSVIREQTVEIPAPEGSELVVDLGSP